MAVFNAGSQPHRQYLYRKPTDSRPTSSYIADRLYTFGESLHEIWNGTSWEEYFSPRIAENLDAAVPVITNELTDVTTLKGNAIELDATATVADGGVLTYQWYGADNTDGDNPVKLNGETNAKYSPPVNTEGDFYYYCEITNTNNDAKRNKIVMIRSNVVKITVS